MYIVHVRHTKATLQHYLYMYMYIHVPCPLWHIKWQWVFFLSPIRIFTSARKVLQGACHMVAMQLATEPLVRQSVRQVFQTRALLSVKPTKKGKKVSIHVRFTDTWMIAHICMHTFSSMVYTVHKQKGHTWTNINHTKNDDSCSVLGNVFVLYT